MHYHHRFIVNAPLADVVAFHRRPANMPALTPPPIIVRFQERPDEIAEGSEMRFTLWMGPLPVRWRARFDQVTPTGFRDTQLQGPFARWEHVHTFVPLDDQRTEVIDTLTVELTPYPFWRFVGRGMVVSFPLFFAWRRWRTRRALVRPASIPPALASAHDQRQWSRAARARLPRPPPNINPHSPRACKEQVHAESYQDRHRRRRLCRLRRRLRHGDERRRTRTGAGRPERQARRGRSARHSPRRALCPPG